MTTDNAFSANGAEGVSDLLARELDNIATLAPFDGMPANHLVEILAGSRIVFYRHGKIICHPEIAETIRCLWLVRQGSVQVTPLEDGQADLASGVLLGIGALLPPESALTGVRAECIYAAAEDSFLWEIVGESLERLLAEPAVLRWVALHLHEAHVRLRDTVAGLLRSRQVADQALALPVISVARGESLTCPVDTPVLEVAALMAARGIGSVVIGSADDVVGIVTQTDLIHRAMASGLDYATPVSAVMTPRPAMIDVGASVFEAGVEMARQRFRHLVVRESEGAVVGIVSERDLFRIQQQGIVQVFQPIDTAKSVDEIAAVAGHIRGFAARVFRQGMEVSQFSRLISSINDRLTRRLLALIAGETHPERRFCWLAFGSEGREEQGFVTDQDNGLVFLPPPSSDIEAVRAGYLGMARRINDALQHCGFDLCTGNIMAGNPQWCLSLDEWKRNFSQWIRVTTPASLLNATVFFDFRGIYGDNELAEQLRDYLIEQISGNSICLHMLAANALQVGPPVGKWNRFITDKGEAKGTIDLKTQGSRLFVDAARVYALASRVRTANTEYRLRAIAKRIRRAPTAIEGDVAAFRFIQTIRLRRQLDSRKDGKAANRIDPYTLNDLDQRMLYESLRQAQSLQDRLKLDYRR